MARPNILIIYPDQLRADVLSCYENPVVATPHIDRLADEGVLCENAFVSFPLCAPFRASFFTGKYAHKTGVYANHYRIPVEQEFLAEHFRLGGYATAYFGKWHLDGGRKHSFVPRGKRRLGFEHFVGFNRGHEYFQSIYYYGDDKRPRTSRRYEPDYQTDHVIEFMDSIVRSDSEQPFLAMVNYGIPHPPLVAPSEYIERYRPEDVLLSPAVPSESAARERARNFLAKYYGLVRNLDDNVGRLLDFLDGQGLCENTLVILVSDHGEMAGEHGLYAKKTYFRSAMRVPYLVRYPAGFQAGFRTGSLIDPAVDTMPTLLSLCELPVPQAVQGRSFLGLLQGEDEPSRDHIYYQILKEVHGEERFPVPERGLRTKEWLFVRTESTALAFFDLINDPWELNNLVEDLDHAGIRAQLDSRLHERMVALEDRWEIEAHFPPVDFQTHAEGSVYHQKLLAQAIVEP